MRLRLVRLSALLLALPVAIVEGQRADAIVVGSMSPMGNLRFGTPTEFVLNASVTVVFADSAVLVLGLNVDDPQSFRTVASQIVRRGTHEVELRATARPVNWTDRGGAFAYSVRLLAPGTSLAAYDVAALAAVKREFFARTVDAVASGAVATRTASVGGPRAEYVPGRTYFEFQVETPARFVSQVPLRFPPTLRAARVEGEVLAQFVVDTTGAPVMPSFKVLKASDDGFVESVREAVAQTRFSPALLAGHVVPQLVQAPFRFRLTGAPVPPR